MFQDRFSSWVIEEQAHLISAIDYIENNPVKAGVVKKREDYAWSSAGRDRSEVSLDSVIG